MAEYAKLIQAYDPDMHLVLILTPQIVELMYTAKSAVDPQDLDKLDLWVDQFLNQHVSKHSFPCTFNQFITYFPGIMAKPLDNHGVPHPTPNLYDGPLYN
jgi:hypothetical protein